MSYSLGGQAASNAATPARSNFAPGDWAAIISGAGQGAGSAMQGAAGYANSKKEAKEAKRRTLANLLNQSLKRQQSMELMGQEHSDEMNDFQTQAMQQMARGFAEALHGATSR